MNQNYISKLQVQNFRNLSNYVFNFSENINCIFGNNGNGKTNLLEAISFLINKKSFKKKMSFPQLISIDCEEPEIIFMSVFTEEEDQSLTAKITTEESRWFKNNKEIKRTGYSTVLISPFDSNLFHTDSQFRKNWIDQYFSLLSTDYKQTLSAYKKSLRFRNTLLQKKPPRYLEQIKANDHQFAELSYKLVNLRKEVIGEMKNYSTMTFKLIFDENDELLLKMDSKVSEFSVEQIQNLYSENLEKDLILGHTKYAVHKDDFYFSFNGYNALEYCSLGQQKMSFLSLVFAYIELFRYKFKTYPIVLMDDVSGELDAQRWHNLVSYLKAKNFQVFITTANEAFKQELEKIENSKKFLVVNGEFKEY